MRYGNNEQVIGLAAKLNSLGLSKSSQFYVFDGVARTILTFSEMINYFKVGR